MIIIYACAVVIGVEAVVLRGRLMRLTTLQVRRFYLVWFALADQVVIISILPGRQHAVLAVANFLSYLAAGTFVWSNRRTPGVLLIGVGGGANVLTIALNGGTMPASARAIAASGWIPPPGHFQNSAVLAHPKLALLGDVFATPRWLPGHDVFSIGDVVIVMAVAILVYRTCARAPAPEQLASENEHAGTADARLEPPPDGRDVDGPVKAEDVAGRGDRTGTAADRPAPEPSRSA